MRDPDVKRALDAAVGIPDPSMTAPPHTVFQLNLDSVVPDVLPATIDPIPHRQHSSDPPSEPIMAVSPQGSPVYKWALIGALGGTGVALLCGASVLAALALYLLF